MNYYVETNFYDHDGLVTSGGKGRDDYFEMMRRCGLKRIVIPTVKSAREVKAPISMPYAALNPIYSAGETRLITAV